MPGPVLPGAAGDKQVLPNWSCTRNQAEFCFPRKCSHWHGSGWSSLTLRRRCQGLREACFQAVSLIAQGSPLQSWPHFLHDSKSNSDMAVPTLVKLELFLGRSQTVLWGSGVSHYRDGWVGGWVPTKPFACRLEMGAQISAVPCSGEPCFSFDCWKLIKAACFQWNASSSELVSAENANLTSYNPSFLPPSHME